MPTHKKPRVCLARKVVVGNHAGTSHARGKRQWRLWCGRLRLAPNLLFKNFLRSFLSQSKLQTRFVYVKGPVRASEDKYNKKIPTNNFLSVGTNLI